MWAWLASVAVAAAAPLVEVEQDPFPTLITDVMVLQPDGTRAGPFDVRLADGRIASVEPAGPVPDKPAARVVEGRGHTLLPGLIDVHTHPPSPMAVPGRMGLPDLRDNLAAYLFAGVTTVLDLGGTLGDIDRYHRHVAAAAPAAPQVVFAGKPFAAPGGHPRASIVEMFPSPVVKWSTRHLAWEVTTADDVDAALATQGITPFVKVILDELPPGAPTLSDEALARLRTGATAFGARLVVHAGRASDVTRALEAGADALAHVPYTGSIREVDVATLARRGIPVMPTLAVWKAIEQVVAGDPWRGPLEAEILPANRWRALAWAADGKASIRGDLGAWAEGLATSEAARCDDVRRLHAAGVEILVGADGPGLGLAAGAGTHRELDLLAGCGLSPSEVLAAATWKNSRFLDPDARYGAVRPGWEADLLLVAGDPTTDLSAVHDPRAVWVDGRKVERMPRR